MSPELLCDKRCRSTKKLLWLQDFCFFACFFVFSHNPTNTHAALTSRCPCVGVHIYFSCCPPALSSCLDVLILSTSCARVSLVLSLSEAALLCSVSLSLLGTICLGFCLLPVQHNVIHQYTSTQPHPVKDHLNVNIIWVLFEEKLPTVCL